MNASTSPNDSAPASGGARAVLRDATAAQHARVDDAFPTGLDTPQAYARYLRGMHRFALDFEQATTRLPRQSRWLERDLAAVGLQPLMEPWASPSPLADDDAVMGWEYVMAGSSLGARVLIRAVHRLGHTGEHGAHFLECQGTSDDWRQVQQRLAAVDVADTPRLARMIDGARTAFTHVAVCLAHGAGSANEEHAL